MKLGLTLLLGIQLLCAAVATADSAPVVLSQPLRELVFSQSGEVHIVGVNQDDDPQLRWLTWGERSEQGSVARLALVGRDNGGSRVLSAVVRQDAYAPSLKAMPWLYGGQGVLAWTYQYGAAVQTLELYGRTGQNQLVKLDEVSGVSIEWSVNAQGQALATVYAQNNAKNLRLTATCYGWQEKQHKLHGVTCH